MADKTLSEKLEELIKALEAGVSLPVTVNSTSTTSTVGWNGSPLPIQSLQPVLQNVTFKDGAWKHRDDPAEVFKDILKK